MSVNTRGRARRHVIAGRIRSQDGAVLIVALMTMLIVMGLLGGLVTLVTNDASITTANNDGKRAYAAAQSALQYYLGQLNANATGSSWWETCSNDTNSGTQVAGSNGESFSYHPVVNSCSGTNAVGTVLDPNTGLLRMQFTGYAGNYGAKRTIVADFRPTTPLQFLWFTAHETVDPNSVSGAANGCNGNTYASSSPPTNSACWLSWGNNDVINGPMYSQDQFYIPAGATPIFGRNSSDAIESSASTVCVSGNGSQQPTAAACPSSATINGTQKAGVATIPLPSQNQALLSDASSNGVLLRSGTTTLTLGVNAQGQTIIQSGVTCTTASSSSCQTTAANGTSLTNLNVTNLPVIYAQGSGSTSLCPYDPTNVSYNTVSSGTYAGSFYGTCGDVFVNGTYGSPLTIGAADDIVVTGNLINSADTNPTSGSSPTGSGGLTGGATLGLVANYWVRVYRPVNNPGGSGPSGCALSNSASNLTIDAAILALVHSFAVDNYDCGTVTTLTVHGAIAQNYRGPVAEQYSSCYYVNYYPYYACSYTYTGYNKNYNYDNRLAYVMPPYVFDLQNTSWNLVRETENNGAS